MQENEEKVMNIVFSSDKNYAQLLGVALCSIFENKIGNYRIDVYILDGGILEEDIKKMDILEKKYNFKINYIKMDSSLFKDFYTRDFYTEATYYRIILPDLLKLHKVLYLDADIIVLSDILELYNTNIENYLFGAVEDFYMGKNRHNILNIPIKEKYFNCGVLLMNLDKCREMNVSQTLLKFINENPSEKLKYIDQDALNAIFWNLFLEVNQKYNFLSLMMRESNANKFILKNNIKIIHYAGEKPWDYFNENKLNKKYFYYLKKTPWKNLKYKNKNTKNIVIKYRKIFYKKSKNFIKKFIGIL